MKSRLNVGIIGCGVIAPTHIRSYLQQRDVEVACVCDQDESKASSLATEYDIKDYTAVPEELLARDDIDCVSICTDHASHAELAVAALEAGKHVLCEKALAATTQGLDTMSHAHARNPELVFSGVFQHRFERAPNLLKKWLAEGKFGDPLTADTHLYCLRTDAYYNADQWRGTWAEEGGSVLINQAIHYIDLLAWIMEGITSVCGAFANLSHAEVIETEDTAVGACEFRNGALGTIKATSSSHLKWEPEIGITGTEGTIRLRGNELLRAEFEDQGRKTAIMQELDAGEDIPGIKAGKEYYGKGHLPQITDFVEAVRQGREPFVPGESARHAVDIVLALYQSHRQEQWVTVNDPNPTANPLS
ncbi:MAG: Gfo/Idh/MocA family protein [Lentisphaeria bacterium]